MLHRVRLPVLAAAVAVLPACSAKDTTAPSHLFAFNPCLPVTTVNLSAAATARLDCSNGGTTVTFAGSGASYLIVPEFATDQAPFQLVNYSMASGALEPNPAASRVGVGAMAQRAAASLAASGAPPARRPMAAQFAMDQGLRARATRVATSSSLRAFVSRAPKALQGAAPRATPPPGSVGSFHVISDVNGTSSSSVAARLAFVGSNILLYVDTLSPAGGFDSSQVQGFGQYFDQVLYPIDTTAFGAPSDVDGNGRAIVLMSPAVNRLTPAGTCATQGFIAGFFNPGDFDGPADPTSNQGEIFYSIVPDPAGTVSCAHSVAELEQVVPATFLHELQHLIGFGQHVVVSGGLPGASWLDEGLSIVAEELGSLHYEAQCPPPACRTNPDQLFPDSSQGFVQNFLFDSYEYAYLPDTASVTLESDADLGSSWRGGAWLLARWLGDQNGGNAFFKRLEQGPSGGVADIEHATGQSFASLFADFGLALYTDSLPELPRTTAPAVNRFVTRNVKQLWARLYVTSGPSPQIPVPEPVQLFKITADTSTAVLYPGTVTYFRLDTPANSATVSIRFAGPGGTAFPGALLPQLAVFRLPPGQ